MKPALVRRTNTRKLVILAVLVLLASVAYLTVDVNPKYLSFAMGLRVPMLLVMLIAAFAIGGASIVFQSIIHNTIVTPCLLGMNSLYTLIHTVVVFLAGSGSILATNANAAFAVDLGIMGVTATVIYSYLFQKTKYNVLYVLLIGTVLTSFFGSIQSTLTRVMDPNEYDSLLSTLVASFSNVNGEIIAFALVVLAAILLFLRRDLALLDVLTLGKEQAINLGVDYDRSLRRLLLGVTLAIAVATAVVGPISFMGLIVANLSRQLLRTYRHTQLVAGSVLFRMVILVAGQLLWWSMCTTTPSHQRIHPGGERYFYLSAADPEGVYQAMHVSDLHQAIRRQTGGGQGVTASQGKVLSSSRPQQGRESTVMECSPRSSPGMAAWWTLPGADIAQWKKQSWPSAWPSHPE